MVAALYVEKDGPYFGLPDVDPWDQARDARTYAGPFPVVAHPPCERWGRFWHGSTRKPHQFKKGDDGGCFAAALSAVRKWGGVIEHPADSRAWRAHGLLAPLRSGGWVPAGDFLGWTCCVSQGQYGHKGDKLTWLYAAGCRLPELKWGHSGKRVLLAGLSRERRKRDQRTGIVQAMSRKQRAATPLEFRDLLLSIARSAVKS